MSGKMVSTMVRMDFARITPIDAQRLEDLAEITFDALKQNARFVAFGPVVSVDFDRTAIEVDFTVCTKHGGDEEIRSATERVEAVVHEALAAAEYETSAERVPAASV